MIAHDVAVGLDRRPTSAVLGGLDREGDVRARDDFLISSSSGLMVLRYAPGGTRPRGVLIGCGTGVACRGMCLGSVDRVLVDPDTDEVRAVVVQPADPAASEVLVPASWVEAVDEDEIILGRLPHRAEHDGLREV